MNEALKADVAKLHSALPNHTKRIGMISQRDRYFDACDPARIRRVLDALEAIDRDAEQATATKGKA